MSVTAELSDGRRLEFPDGTTPDVVQATVKKVLSGVFEKKPEEDDPFAPVEKLDRKLRGAAEAALSVGSAATTGMIARAGGALAGIAGSITSGKYGTREGVKEAERVSEEAAQKFTYEPKTEEGKDALRGITDLFDRSKLAGLGPSEVISLNAAKVVPTRPVVGHAARVIRDQSRELRERISPAPEMVGVGSAETAQATIRRERSGSLPVPIKLTKGQAERSFEQQQFERETAKNPKLGGPLRERYAEQNQKILQNFDAWIDQTGAEAGSLRATGEAVTQAVVDKSNKAKYQIRAAYEAARNNGDMQERIDISPIQRYLDEHQAEAINAPVLSSVEAKISRIAKDGTVSLNDLEEVRKMVGRLSGKDATNAIFGREVKGVIDQITEGKGGDMYKKARSLRFRYAQEFEDHAVVDKLLSFKPGTKDRSVAYEDVFSHSILKGSLDDVRTIRKTLQTAGPKGTQAWHELQGATLRHLRDEITNNVQIDHAGANVISPAKLNKLVTELDQDGKLDFIFGKHGAQQIRDINGIAKDAFTAPPGAVNHSNTASILMMMLDKVTAKVTGIPFVGSAAGYVTGEIKNAGIRKRVNEALE